MHGPGRIVLPSGVIFEGEFHRGFMNEGILIKPNGEVVAVRFNYQ
jgi:hypothetical protein